MKTNSQLRQVAGAQLKGHYTNFVIVSLSYLVIAIASAFVPYVGTLLSFFLCAPMAIAYTMMLLGFVRKGEDPTVEGLFCTFNSTWYLKSVCVELLMAIYTFLWTLLLIVPGIIKSISYSMAPYILADNPELSSEQAICRSMEMMEGHKMDYFLIWLGYLVLALLSILLLYIPMLWIAPYYQVVFTNFYLGLKEGAKIVTE